MVLMKLFAGTLVDSVREGESGADGENSIDIFVSPYVKLIAGEKLLYNTGNLAWCSVMT